jgi:hypothetical protein
MEDFTRLTLLIPAAAAHAVKVGTAVRVNGTPLLVASVGGGRNGADVTASFGVSMASHATRDLTAGLYADATVSVEIKDAFAGAMDLATPRESEREGDGLPGSAQWYSNTLPWYSTVYPGANPGAVEAGPAGGERVDYGKNMTDYERYTLEQSRKWSQSQSQGGQQPQPPQPSHRPSPGSQGAGPVSASYPESRQEEDYSSRSSSASSSYFPPPPAAAAAAAAAAAEPASSSSSSSSSSSPTYVTPDAVDDYSTPSFSSSPEAEAIIDTWSQPQSQSPESSWLEPPLPPPPPVNGDDNYYSYSAAAASSITAITPVVNGGSKLQGVSPEDVAGAVQVESS